MTEGSFFCQEEGESRYEETIPDRPTTRGATVPPVGPRRESQHPVIFPMAEVVGLLQEGVGHLLREAGLTLMNLVMEEEVRHLAGERHQQYPERRAHRWGKEDGYCVVDGQKVPIRRTRLRSPENREQRLGSYELFQRSGPMEHAVWDKMMRRLF